MAVHTKLSRNDILEIDISYDIKVCLVTNKYTFTISGEEVIINQNGIDMVNQKSYLFVAIHKMLYL